MNKFRLEEAGGRGLGKFNTDTVPGRSNHGEGVMKFLGEESVSRRGGSSSVGEAFSLDASQQLPIFKPAVDGACL
jgi:hypothetical protein